MSMFESELSGAIETPKSVPNFNYLSENEAKQLLDQGNISQEAYQAIVQQKKQELGDTDPKSSPYAPGEVEQGIKQDLTKLSRFQDDIQKKKNEAEAGKETQDLASNEGVNKFVKGSSLPTTPDEAAAQSQFAAQPQTQIQGQSPIGGQGYIGGSSGFNPLEGYETEEKGIKAQAKIVQDQAEKEAQSYESARAATDMIAQNQEMINQRHTQRMSEEVDKLNQMREDYSNTNIDPSRFWSDMGTGNKILAGISLGLGAIGGMVDGKNRVADIFENAINRDVNIQKANLDKKSQAMTAQRGVLADMRMQFSDENSAIAATKVAAYDRLKSQIEQTALQYKGPMAQAQAQVMLGGIQEKRDNAILEFARARQFAPDMVHGSLADREIGMKVPPQEQTEAFKEIAEAKKYNDNTQAFKNILIKMQNKSIGTRIGEKFKIEDVDKASLLSLAKDISGGDETKKSKMEELIRPFTTGIIAKGDLQKKIEAADVIFKGSQPVTPTLSRRGVNLDKIFGGGQNMAQQMGLPKVNK